jgi:hypothetical protein
MMRQLKLGDEIKAAITVRGGSVTEDFALQVAAPRLSDWQGLQSDRLPDGAHFEASDAFTAKPQGEYSVTRTLKVVEDNGPAQEHEA